VRWRAAVGHARASRVRRPVRARARSFTQRRGACACAPAWHHSDTGRRRDLAVFRVFAAPLARLEKKLASEYIVNVWERILDGSGARHPRRVSGAVFSLILGHPGVSGFAPRNAECPVSHMRNAKCPVSHLRNAKCPVSHLRNVRFRTAKCPRKTVSRGASPSSPSRSWAGQDKASGNGGAERPRPRSEAHAPAPCACRSVWIALAPATRVPGFRCPRPTPSAAAHPHQLGGG
jgi:hypothetical protein